MYFDIVKGRVIQAENMNRKGEYKYEEVRGIHLRNRRRRTMPPGSDAVWAKIREWQERMQEEAELGIDDMMLREFDTKYVGRNND